MWGVDLLLSLTVPLLGVLTWPLVRRRITDPGLSEGPAGFALSLALALGWLQIGGMVLGMGGWLTEGYILLWLGLGLGLVTWGGRPYSLRFMWTRPSPWLGLMLLCWMPIVLLSLVPPWYRDSMVYHLALPREYAQAGGMVITDDNIFASFPLGYESILSLLHRLGDAPDRYPAFNPRLVGAWISLAAALSTTALCRLLGSGARVSWAAGIAMLLVPTWMEFGASAYVEPYLVLLSTLALCAGVRAVEGEDSAGLPLALLLGLAAGVKYPGLAVLGFVLLGVLIVQLMKAKESDGDISLLMAQWLPLAATAAVLAAPFYMRNLLERGNPIFPLAFDSLGGEGWDTTRAWMYAETLRAYGEGRGLLDYLLLPVRLFTSTDLRTGFQGSIGPLPLIFVGFGLWRLRTHGDARHRLVGGFGVIWALFWALNVQQTRFFLVGLSPLLALGIWGVSHRPLREQRIGLALAWIGMVVWSIRPLDQVWRPQQTGAWLTGEISEDEIMDGVMPWTWRVYGDLESYVPEDGKIWLVHTRAHTYYLRRDYRLDCVFEEWRLVESLVDGPDSARFEDELRAEGFTHLLINHAFFLTTVDDETRSVLEARFASMLEQGLLVREASWQIIEGEVGEQVPMVLYRVELDA